VNLRRLWLRPLAAFELRGRVRRDVPAPGALVATKDERGRWDVDELSLLRRKDRIAHKRSSRVHDADARARRREEAAGRFAS
jgi:hypothetical protein